MKNFLSFLISFFFLILLAVGLLISVKTIPDEWIKKNVYTSAEFLVNSGDSVKIMGNPFWKLDNFTDSWMLNITYKTDTISTFQQILLNPYVDSEILTKEEILKELTETPFPPDGVNSHYGRYWHGYQITLKPLLLLTDYKGIRIINTIIVFILFFIAMFLCYRRLPLIYGILLILVFCLFYLPVGPISLQFSTCFIISFIAIIIILFSFPYFSKNNKCPMSLFFFIIGSMTSFFDLLTTPLITLGLPLIIYGGLIKKMSIKKTIILSCFWTIGYFLFWMTKWMMVSIFTDFDMVTEAINQIQYRSIGEVEVNTVVILKKILIPIFSLLIILGFLFYLYIFNSHNSSSIIQKIKSNFNLILIAYYPIAWFLLISNHSFNHIWFTYRSWTVTFFALILFMYNIIYEKDSHTVTVP